MVGPVRRTRLVAKRSSREVQRDEQKFDGHLQNQSLPQNPRNEPEVKVLKVEVQIAEQEDQFTQNTQARGETNPLSRSANTVLLVANQRL